MKLSIGLSVVICLGSAGHALGQQGNLLEQLQKKLEKSQTEESPSAKIDVAKGESTPPLSQVESLMLQAGERILSGKTDQETQRLQTSALLAMDQLLQEAQQQQEKQAKKTQPQPMDIPQQPPPERLEDDQKDSNGQQESSPDGGKRSSGQGGNTPTSVAGAGGPVVDEPLPTKVLSENVWGHLPERVRRQLNTVTAEQYLPGYRTLIEAYYRRLVEDNNLKSRAPNAIRQ